VSALLVAEGDPVRAGQALVRLDDTRVRGEARSLRAQQAAVMAREARLLAERDGRDDLAAPDAQANAETAAAYAMERQLFASRRATLAGEL
ncbi:biotin/lipoyl-binding protein, partial [Cupriavidus sp. SIMBA_020]